MNKLEVLDLTEWVTPFVSVKKDRSVCICVDWKNSVNSFLEIDHFFLPRIEELYSLCFNKIAKKLEWLFQNIAGTVCFLDFNWVCDRNTEEHINTLETILHRCKMLDLKYLVKIVISFKIKLNTDVDQLHVCQKKYQL